MIAQEVLATEKVSEQISLVNGVYNSSQARDIIKNLIDAQINFYKLENLKLLEGCHSEDNNYLLKKIDELIQKRDNFNSLINKAKEEGLEINMESTFEIKLSK